MDEKNQILCPLCEKMMTFTEFLPTENKNVFITRLECECNKWDLILEKRN